MADIAKSLSALREFLQSEEVKESMKKYQEEKEQEKKLYASQVERFYQKHKDNMPAIIEKIMAKYDSNAYVNKEYKLGYQPREHLYWVLLSIANQYGTEIELTKENCEKYPRLNMFTSCAYTFEGYLLQQMDGQGSVVRINKI